MTPPALRPWLRLVVDNGPARKRRIPVIRAMADYRITDTKGVTRIVRHPILMPISGRFA